MQEVLVNDKHANDIWYLSDLHFDHAENQSIYAQRIKNFFEIVTAQSDVTFVLAGDFFDDFRKTEKFIAELEDQKVTCVLVLGNHDYWSGGDFTYAEVRNHLAAATSENQYAHLLLTGRVIQISDQVFIGDSGFTDFRYRAETWFERDGKTLELIDHPDSVANVGDFGVNFVELQQVRNWHIKDIQEMHAGWIEFANKQIKTLQNLIVVTHWPMFSVSPYDPISTWWQSKSALLKTDRYWSIYGHTHVSGLNGHDIAKQVGYRAKWDFAGLEFGRLVHVPATHAVAQIELAIRKYERFGVVDPVKSPDSKSRISRRGYIRAAHPDNKDVLAKFTEDPETFFAIAEPGPGSEISALNGLIDADAYAHNQRLITVKAAVNILKKGYQNNIFDFYTALIIAGYAYNSKIDYLEEMRPLDIYDIVRLYMLLFTYDYFKDKVNIHDNPSIRGSRTKDKIGLDGR